MPMHNNALQYFILSVAESDDNIGLYDKTFVSAYGNKESNMLTDSEKRLESFEKMLLSIQQDYDAIGRKMQMLKAEAFDKTFPYKEKLKLPGQLF